MCGPSESAKHDQQAAYVRCSRGLRAAWRDQQGLAAAEKALLALVALAMILMVGRIILSGSRVASDRSVAMLTESSAAPAISWNDSGRPSGDATMSSGSSGSRGGGFLDGLGGAISDGWGAIQEAGRQVGGFVYGVGTGAVEMVKGTAELVWSVGKMTVGELIDPAAAQAERDKWGQVISAVVEDPGKVWDAITEPIVESWKRGDYGEAIGRGFFEAASTVVGPKGLNKIGTIGRVSSKADDVARIGNALEDVAKTGNKLDDAGRVGNKLDDAADASRVSSTGPRKVCEGPSCLCFSSDTPVMTASGPQPISELRPGDLVLSKDEQTGETALRSIVSVFVTPERPLMALTIQTESGQTETLRLTDSHPMYAKGKGFVAARELLSGDELVNSAGAPLIVVGSESLFERDTVYNLEVEGFHTYFAGRQGVWAHNDCDGQSPGEKFSKIKKPEDAPTAYSDDPRFKDFVKDPAHNGKVSPTSVREAMTGLEAEKRGIVKGPIERGPSRIDFYGGDGVPYDVKTPPSPPSSGAWKFDPKEPGDSILKQIRDEFPNKATGRPEHVKVLLDTSYMNPLDRESLWKYLENNANKEELARIIELQVELPSVP